VAGVAVDRLGAGRLLRDEARHLERDEGAAHAPDEAEDRERLQVEPAGPVIAAADPQQVQDDRQRQDDRDIRQKKQKNALAHGVRLSRANLGGLTLCMTDKLLLYRSNTYIAAMTM